MGKLPLPLAVCKYTSRTFSAFEEVKNVQEKSGSRDVTLKMDIAGYCEMLLSIYETIVSQPRRA
jgi:hypothetical protein